MIDYEADIFNAVYPNVAPLCARNSFRNIHVPVPSAFPAACLFEMRNSTDLRRRTGNAVEDFAVVTYEAHAYAMTKPECKEVFNALDSRMLALGFNRISSDQIPNQSNTQVFEYVARYQAEIDQNGVVYRRR